MTQNNMIIMIIKSHKYFQIYLFNPDHNQNNKRVKKLIKNKINFNNNQILNYNCQIFNKNKRIKRIKNKKNKIKKMLKNKLKKNNRIINLII